MTATAAAAPLRALAPRHRELLLRLLETPTAGPLEGEAPTRVREAQDVFAAAAARLGFEVELHASPPAAALDAPEVPLPVRDAVARMGPEFLACQPNLVLRLGERRSHERTLMFNVHLDTVAGEPPVGFRDGRFTGRGAVDAKGPAVALLAGLERALAQRGGLDEVCVLLQVVAGEEGGAMGVHGTRVLVDEGFVGRLNVFCEPTEHRFLDRATASMTARISLAGRDASDDSPGTGHNATVALGYLAQRLARRLVPPVESLGGRVCIAGLETGGRHNRVYGSGSLWLNLAYANAEAGGRIESLVESAFGEARAEFAVRFAELPAFALTATEIHDVARLEWVKKGLPVLANRDPGLELMLERDVRIPRADDGAFTCDAIWMHAHPYAIVYGPGSLARNLAHADGEFVDEADLAGYAVGVARIVTAFAQRGEL